MIKKLWIVFVCALLPVYGNQFDDQSDDGGYIIQASQKQATPIAIVLCGPKMDYLKNISAIIRKDLEFTDRFILKEFYQEDFFKPSDFPEYKGGMHFFIVLNVSRDDDGAIQWRLYKIDRNGDGVFIKGGEDAQLPDTVDATFLFSADEVFAWWVHTISHSMYMDLTGETSPFLSKIAYCKELVNSIKGNYLCVAHYDGSYETVVVPGKDDKGKQINPDTKCLFPCWAGTNVHPWLMYSQYTLLNLRLMKTNFVQISSIATDFDGINMLPTFSSNGKESLVCLSYKEDTSDAQSNTNIWRFIPDKKGPGGEYIKITDNGGQNLSPSILNNGQIAYSSDYELSGTPHIYLMEKNGDNPIRISESNGKIRGAATSPSYSRTKNKLAYVQEVSGTYQLMVYDIATDKTEQITFDGKRKENPSWSPCGNYIVCSVNDGMTKRLVCYKLLTKTSQTIRPSIKNDPLSKSDGSLYSFPAWSQFLEVATDLD